MKVLMIDDDEALCIIMQEFFELEGHTLNYCYTAKTWPILIQQAAYDAIILDLSLPETSGLIILKKLVEEHDIPVVLLTAQGSDLDHITSLKIGAEDYIDKPCNPQVLISRLTKMIERKKSTSQKHKAEKFNVGPMEINCHSRKVFIHSTEIQLTTTEFRVLELLASSPGKGFTKSDISIHALGRKTTDYDRSIDAHMYKLRKKIETVENSQIQFETIYGYGYKLEYYG